MRIYTLDLGFQNLEHTIAAFVLEGPGGLALVETGPYSTFQNLEKQLAQKGWTTADIQQVLVTHIHEAIVPLFENYVRDQLLAAGLDATSLARYEAANPAYMSVAGLMRYWTKKLRQ